MQPPVSKNHDNKKNTTEAPTAASIEGTGPMNLADHRIGNAMLEMLFDYRREGVRAPKAPKKVGFIEFDAESGIYWFTGCNSFLDIFNKLTALNGKSSKVMVEVLKERAGIKADISLEDLERQLSLQLEHFGVETGWAYAVLPSSLQGDELIAYKNMVIAHRNAERTLHLEAVNSLFKGDFNSYRDWRKSNSQRDIDFHTEKGMHIKGSYNYNKFTQLAHEIAQSEAPVNYGEAVTKNGNTKVPKDFQAPTAAAVEKGDERQRSVSAKFGGFTFTLGDNISTQEILSSMILKAASTQGRPLWSPSGEGFTHHTVDYTVEDMKQRLFSKECSEITYIIHSIFALAPKTYVALTVRKNKLGNATYEPLLAQMDSNNNISAIAPIIGITKADIDGLARIVNDWYESNIKGDRGHSGSIYVSVLGMLNRIRKEVALTSGNSPENLSDLMFSLMESRDISPDFKGIIACAFNNIKTFTR
jgi:hypothetical protein